MDKNMPSKEELDKFIENFMGSLNQSFCKSYSDFNPNTTDALTQISLKLKNTIDGFTFFESKDEKGVLECKQLILTLNIIAAKTSSTITVMADEEQNRINVGIRGESVCLDGELLQLLALSLQTCHSLSLFDSGMYFSYDF